MSSSVMRNRKVAKEDEDESAAFLSGEAGSSSNGNDPKSAAAAGASPEEFAHRRRAAMLRKYEQKKKKERQERMERWVNRLNWLSDKVQVLAWTAAGCFLAYYINFFGVFWENEDVDRFWLNVALVCLGVNSVLFFYLSFLLPYVFKVEEEWEVYCPRVIPAATVVGVLFTFASMLAFWPVWGWITIPIFFIFFMAFFNVLQLLPGGILGSLIFFAGVILLVLYSHYLKI